MPVKHHTDEIDLLYMDVSKNSGTPNHPILIGFSIINHPLWGTTVFGNTHVLVGDFNPVERYAFLGIPGSLTVESEGFFFSGALHKHEEIIISLASWNRGWGIPPRYAQVKLDHLPRKSG